MRKELEAANAGGMGTHVSPVAAVFSVDFGSALGIASSSASVLSC